MPDSPGNAAGLPRDHSRLAGNYLIWLGFSSLLTLNLAGLLFLWFGPEVREHHEGFRKATIWVLGLSLIACVGVLAWATFAGTEGFTADVLFAKIDAPPLWLVYLFFIPALVMYGLPVYWLIQDSYKQQEPPAAR